jgi:hypothetical protein
MSAIAALARCKPNISSIASATRCSGKQLEMQWIERGRGDPPAILHRRADILGEGGSGLCAARGAPALVRAVLGDHQRLRLGQVEGLAGGMAVSVRSRPCSGAGGCA